MSRKKKTESETEKLKDKAEKIVDEIKDKIEDIKENKKEKAKELEGKIDKKEEKDIKEEKDTEKLKEEIKEKAKKFAEKIDKKEEKDIKEEVKGSKKAEKTLFPLDDYVKYSAHLGTKAITPHMRKFVYKRRADGLAVLNTNSIDKKLKEAIEFLIGFKAEDIFLACKREAGWKATQKFGEVTGIKVFTKKYPAGVITNTKLDDFFETELVIICDPWLDKNALNDAVIVKTPVIGLCDTNNLTVGITKVVPCNNKAGKSLGLILYLIAREYLKAKGDKTELKIDDFAGEVVERERKDSKGAKEGV